jgi:hypothetical protein
VSRLPLNAQAFFTPNKPKSYLYLDGDNANRGVITGRKVEVLRTTMNEMENKPAHLLPPNLQPHVIPIQQNKTSQIRTTTTSQQSHAVTQAWTQKRVIQQPVKQSQPHCKYVKRTTNPGCGCGALQCSNQECPLSKPSTKGSKIYLNSNNCCQQSCRWFTQQ